MWFITAASGRQTWARHLAIRTPPVLEQEEFELNVGRRGAAGVYHEEIVMVRSRGPMSVPRSRPIEAGTGHCEIGEGMGAGRVVALLGDVVTAATHLILDASLVLQLR